MRSMAEAPITLIEPTRRLTPLLLREYWHYRDLLYFLVWRDVKVRYKQTLLGVGWAILVPLTQMVIFGVIFGKVARLSSDGLNPFLFYLCGLVPWQYFSNSLTLSSGSLVAQSHLMTKVYFPRLFIPLSACLASGVDLAIAFALLLGVMLCLGLLPAATVVLVPLLIVIAFAVSLGAGLALSALSVKYRDVRFVVPFLVQVWMYGSVLLPFSQLPEQWGAWRYLYALNPMVGVIESFRWCLLHPEMEGVNPPWLLLAMGIPATLLLLAAGIRVFHRTERQFADTV
jgi:lipopolysaccharide transport system permease protein